MKKILLLCGMLIALSATVASAAGVNIAWDNCVGGGGNHIKLSACAVNTGSQTLYNSVRAPAGMDLWLGFEAVLYFGFEGPQPAWWQLRNEVAIGQINQCRNGSLSASADFTSNTGCEDAYLGQGAGGIGQYRNEGNRARLNLVFAVPPGNEAPLTPDAEYYVAKVTINNAKTVGAGLCAGCLLGACINLASVNVVQPLGAPGGDVNVTNMAESNTAVWQATGEPACLGLPTPATRATWGSVKSLYR